MDIQEYMICHIHDPSFSQACQAVLCRIWQIKYKMLLNMIYINIIGNTYAIINTVCLIKQLANHVTYKIPKKVSFAIFALTLKECYGHQIIDILICMCVNDIFIKCHLH